MVRTKLLLPVRAIFEFMGIATMLLLTLLGRRCGNVAAILELNDNLESNYKIFDAAVGVEARGAGLRKRAPDYFL
jgi:hypothetical protein